jgi:hypothetical protein
MFLKGLRFLLCGLFLVSVTTVCARSRDKEEKTTRPEAQPEVNEKQLQDFRKSNKEIAQLYDEVQGSLDELGTVTAAMEEASPKEKRKLEMKQRALRSSAIKARRKLDKLLKKKIGPLEKSYNQAKSKYDELEAKAKEKEEGGNTKRAQKYHQEASTLGGKLGSAKRSLDLLYYHCFFKGDELLEDQD